MFYDTGTRHEKALITNIPRVRDPEETILCPRVMATNTFFPVTFFFGRELFLKVLQHKEEEYENKIMQKKL